MEQFEPNPQIREILIGVQKILREAYASKCFGEWRASGSFEPEAFGRAKGGNEFTLTQGHKPRRN